MHVWMVPECSRRMVLRYRISVLPGLAGPHLCEDIVDFRRHVETMHVQVRRVRKFEPVIRTVRPTSCESIAQIDDNLNLLNKYPVA